MNFDLFCGDNGKGDMMSIKSNAEFDIVVVGGGLAGLTAALALSTEIAQATEAAIGNARVALVMPKSDRIDGRTTALLGQSVDYLEKLGVWQECVSLSAPLSTMRIIDGTSRLWRAPPVDFKAVELGLDAFGFNIANAALGNALLSKIKAQSKIVIIEDSISDIQSGAETAQLTTANKQSIYARLVIAADGKNSIMRQKAGISVHKWQYPQMAVALNFTHQYSHNFTSTEFHTEEGPFTIVPMTDLDGKYQSGLVWVMHPENADRFLLQDLAKQEKQVEEKMQSILGKISFATTAQQFPLSGMIAKQFADNRVALVGDAAHLFPPIGAQGFNLGLRDVREICTFAGNALSAAKDPGSLQVMDQYNRSRRRDVSTRTGAVDMLNRSLLTDFLPVQAVRGLGLFALANIPVLRKFAMRQGLSVARQKPSSAA